MTPRFIISGGGTGGHVFPAISIADAIKKEIPDSEILFVGAKGRMEMEQVPAAGYEIIGLPVAGFQRRVTVKNFTFFYKLASSLNQSSKIVRSFNPGVVIGVGGYASGPVLKIAATRGIPTLIQEQNSFPGLTNRLLARSVNKICVAYPGMERFFPPAKIVFTGNPVRKTLTFPVNREEARTHFGLKKNLPTILAIGGSLGAGGINKSLSTQVDLLTNKNIQLLWQCGSSHAIKTNAQVDIANMPNVKVIPFINRMELAYGAADVVISRAGAGTLSELALLGKPSVLVPSPNVAEDHQAKNAKALAEAGAALIVEEHGTDDTPLLQVAINLVENLEMMASLRQNIQTFARPNAASDIAREVIKLLNS